jgi:hypothetical protein
MGVAKPAGSFVNPFEFSPVRGDAGSVFLRGRGEFLIDVKRRVDVNRRVEPIQNHL